MITNPRTGEMADVQTGNYKVINPDGTYFTFVVWAMGSAPNGTTIGQYGTYEINSDSIIVENIIKHSINPNLNGKKSTLKYELIDEKTLIMAWSPNNINWVNERWTRLPLST